MLKITVYWEKTHTVRYAQYVINTNNLMYVTVHLTIHILSIYLSMFPTNTAYHRLSQAPSISSVRQCIPHILWKPKILHTFHQNPILVTILSRLNPVHVNIRHFLQTHFIKRVYAQVGTFFQVFVGRTMDIIPFTLTRATCTAHFTIQVAVQIYSKHGHLDTSDCNHMKK